ncbi:solute carrier family 35 member C2-like [Nylanderia fulva]|uniref:solute carrier family 35 member C2-like n=1 Tax=Nylanderia fulva TaxID=613905 RepID=UPI0010FB2FCE|nr:solute carrier family 35 member C2-like [Nylanderia fulva]
MISGMDSGVNIGLSNCFNIFVTMTKSTTIIFILGFSLLFKLEKKSWSLVGIVVMIAGGLAMFTYKSTHLVFSDFIVSSSFVCKWYSMNHDTTHYAKIQTRSPRSDRYDVLYATLDVITCNICNRVV